MLKKVLMLLSLLIVTSYAGEGTLEKAQHRLPPVIYSIDIPKTVKPNQTYDFKWTVMGYHDDYNVVIHVYDKNYKLIGEKTVSSYDETEGQYSWNPIRSTKFFYETEMKLDFSGSQELTIRFFASPPNDDVDTSYLSCLVPGGLGYKAGDTTGRKILIDGVDTPTIKKVKVLSTSFGGSGKRFNGDKTSRASLVSYETTYEINTTGTINRLRISLDNGNSSLHLHPWIKLQHNGENIALTPNNFSYEDVESGVPYITLDVPLSVKIGDKLTVNLRAGTNGGDDNTHWNIGVTNYISQGISSMSSKYSTSSDIPDLDRPEGEGLMFSADFIIEE